MLKKINEGKARVVKTLKNSCSKVRLRKNCIFFIFTPNYYFLLCWHMTNLWAVCYHSFESLCICILQSRLNHFKLFSHVSVNLYVCASLSALRRVKAKERAFFLLITIWKGNYHSHFAKAK